jgi:hypothetical protein
MDHPAAGRETLAPRTCQQRSGIAVYPLKVAGKNSFISGWSRVTGFIPAATQVEEGDRF